MNSAGEKFVSLFLVFALMTNPANLYAKERRGAKLIVIKKDGGQIEGELIAVKSSSLLLLNTEGKDVSVDVEEIKVIKIVYKKLVFVGACALGGSLGGALGGAYVGLVPGSLVAAFSATGSERVSVSSLMVGLGAIGALVGLIAGAIVGAVVKPVETIKIEGKSDKKIKKNLKKLRKKARIRDYR